MTTARREQYLSAALRAAERGWHVFPVRPRDKRPAITDWQRRATTEADRIVRCWSAGTYNIGIACGPSRLVVVDLDVAKPEAPAPQPWAGRGITHGQQVLELLAAQAGHEVPKTVSVRTASGGLHLYFAADDDRPLRNSAGRMGWLIDTRAEGGYVVAAGSVVAGRTYWPVDDVAVASLPAWIGAALRPVPVTSSALALGEVSRLSRYAAAAMRQEICRVLAAQPGSRNHTLNAAAFALGQLVAAGVLPRSDTAEALHLAGASIGLRDKEIVATVDSGLSAGAKHPRALSA